MNYYKIYINKNELKVELDKDFKNNFDWVNKEIVYSNGDCLMYSTENNIESCKIKLLNYLKKEECEIIKKSKEKLKLMKDCIYNIKIN